MFGSVNSPFKTCEDVVDIHGVTYSTPSQVYIWSLDHSFIPLWMIDKKNDGWHNECIIWMSMCVECVYGGAL